MSVMIVAGLMMAQAPATVPPEKPVTVVKKPKQVCEMIEVTGSRARKRVCRDENGTLDLGPGVSRMGVQGKVYQQPGASGRPPGS